MLINEYIRNAGTTCDINTTSITTSITTNV